MVDAIEKRYPNTTAQPAITDESEEDLRFTIERSWTMSAGGDDVGWIVPTGATTVGGKPRYFLAESVEVIWTWTNKRVWSGNYELLPEGEWNCKVRFYGDALNQDGSIRYGRSQFDITRSRFAKTEPGDGGWPTDLWQWVDSHMHPTTRLRIIEEDTNA